MEKEIDKKDKLVQLASDKNLNLEKYKKIEELLKQKEMEKHLIFRSNI